MMLKSFLFFFARYLSFFIVLKLNKELLKNKRRRRNNSSSKTKKGRKEFRDDEEEEEKKKEKQKQLISKLPALSTNIPKPATVSLKNKTSIQSSLIIGNAAVSLPDYCSLFCVFFFFHSHLAPANVGKWRLIKASAKIVSIYFPPEFIGRLLFTGSKLYLLFRAQRHPIHILMIKVQLPTQSFMFSFAYHIQKK
jgi:hypothetical protein